MLAILAWTSASAAIVKTVDRKFPEGLCPIETRLAAGVDPSFLAPAATVRVSFSVSNYTGGNHNYVHLDNVAVVPKSVFESHQVVTPGFEGCYDPFLVPPGQSTGGILNAPAYDFNALGTTEALLDLFDGDASGWTGAGVYFDPDVQAPSEPATGSGFVGGSLGLGRDVDGNITVRASKMVSGLTPGAEYVVLTWWYTFNTPELTIEVDVPCPDSDLDTFADCSAACDLQAGTTCGDCADADPAVHPGVSDTSCDGIDNDCDGEIDGGFPQVCQCTMPAPDLVSWWPADGTPDDIRGGNHGTLENGASFVAGQAGQALSLDGVDDYVRVPHSPTLDPGPGSFTFAAWVRTATTGAAQIVMSKYECGGFCPSGVATPLHTLYLSSSGAPYFDLRDLDSDDIQTLGSATSVADGAWHHLAVVRDIARHTMSIYADGQLLASSALTALADGVIGDSDGEADPLLLGAQFQGGTSTVYSFFSGLIDEVVYHDRALGASEIQALHDAGSVQLCRCTDADFDGYGSVGGVTCPAGTLQDCDDSAGSSNPGAPELCNGVDDDCDTTLDDGLAQSTFYRDVDGDGHGAPPTTIQACAAPAGYSASSADCNDADASVHPGAADSVCDAIDQNCSGTADEEFVSPPNGWIATPLAGAPSARRVPSMVSTGDRVIVWGGLGTTTNAGGIYRPRDAATDTWIPTTLTNAPTARFYHTAVWTGTEMIVWGGSGGGNTGGLYNPSTNTWAATTLTNAPTARQQHSAVWTSTHMVVWGGSATNTGGAYLPGPFGGTWTALPTTGAPVGRSGHTAVWTGTYMVVWGGFNGGTLYNTGGRYNPTTNTWSTMAASPLSGRSRHTVVWTGSRMIVWGGYNGLTYLSDGASYDPVADAWTPIAAGPPGRYGHTAVWDATNGLMVIWGGFGAGPLKSDGWAYDPQANTWTSLPTTGAPIGRYDHAAAWLSATREMVVWGGNALPDTNTGGRIVTGPTTCGVGACIAESSYTCTVGQLGYGACTPGTPTTEVCNGLDDDCNAATDDGIAAPSGRPALELTRIDTEGVLYWTPVAGATGYDVVRGELLALRSSAGDFTASTTSCIADDTANLYASEGSLPNPGDGTWVLVRAVNACGGNGSYDDDTPSQQGSRDAEIAASPAPCP